MSGLVIDKQIGPNPLTINKSSSSFWGGLKDDIYGLGGFVSKTANTISNLTNYIAPLIQMFGGEVDPAQDVLGKGLELLGNAAKGVSVLTNPSTDFTQKLSGLGDVAMDTAMNAINPLDEDSSNMINMGKNLLSKRLGSTLSTPRMETTKMSGIGPRINRAYELG